VDIKIQDRALQQGTTNKPVAGYIYFPVSAKQRKNAHFVLHYLKDDVSIEIPLP
jgi:hypothetical protein